ncbi:MAG: nicotinate-nucleotide adenylyltransferase [Dehalococcoidia bacterium]|nr:nicotinate-nucleotide adenylyltransferase [Chloroflexota bacterium]MCK4221386.1 nicotinate-nucleotide adenylyltransferase [Dehalococcoidia bacterium]MCK4262589.1 nicotinate-nucleotide adenylyltransferase [Dehalococcoidia bacterium]
MNIGVLGGTFDPVHIGHLIIAEQARVELGLSEVLFVPAGQPWLKVDHNVTPAFHRVEMLRRAVASNPHFRVCTLEVDRAGPSYTVDTMAGLKDELGTQSFFFILGQDSFDDLPLWKEPDRLVRMCQLAVVPRLGLRSPGLNSLTSSVRGAQGRVRTVSAPVVEVSSSEIRQRVAQGLSIRYLVPHEVEQYIAAQGLYQK